MEDVALLAYKEHRKTTATLLVFVHFQNGRAYKLAFKLGPEEILNFEIYSDFLVLLKSVTPVTFWATISIHMMSKDETINTSILNEIYDTCLSHGNGKEETHNIKAVLIM